MISNYVGKRLTSFQIIIAGFLGAILIGTLLLVLPFSAKSGQWTAFDDALFTSTSAVCVTGLVVQDTATYWSGFGQVIILILIQIGGLGVISVAAFIAAFSGRKISLLQRSILQDSISAHQIGGIVVMTKFIFRVAFIVETVGAVILMPTFCIEYGVQGVWMAFFHSISAFCNAGFDLMGDKTGKFSSFTSYSDNIAVVLPICLLIIIGGISFLTWDDLAVNKLQFKRYRMQTKTILVTTAVLIFIPAVFMLMEDYADFPIGERISLAFFQSVTTRTAGFNTADLTTLDGTGRAIMVILMLIGGSPGSTAGGMKTTTIVVLFANAVAVFRRKKNAQLFGRRIDDTTVKTASTLLLLYVSLVLLGAFIINRVDDISVGSCIFETSSAIATVGLSLGITPSLSLISRFILIVLMFFGRVGGLTLMYAAISSSGVEVSQCPVEKINVG